LSSEVLACCVLIVFLLGLINMGNGASHVALLSCPVVCSLLLLLLYTLGKGSE